MVEREERYVTNMLDVPVSIDEGNPHYFIPAEVSKHVGSGYVVTCPYTTFAGRVVRRLMGWMTRKKWISWRDYSVQQTRLMRVTINFQEIDKAICQSTRAVELISGRRVNVLILGRPEYQHLRNIIETQMPPGYISRVRLTNGERLDYHGMRLVIVPWFNGILPIYLEGEER